MYHRVRRKMIHIIISAILLCPLVCAKSITIDKDNIATTEDNFDNNLIDFDVEYSDKLDAKYGNVPWHSSDNFNKQSHRYVFVNEDVKDIKETNKDINKSKENNTTAEVLSATTTEDYSVIPLELITTTESPFLLVRGLLESTTEDLSVIPLSTEKPVPNIEIKQTVILSPSTENSEIAKDEIINTSTASTNTVDANSTNTLKEIEISTDSLSKTDFVTTEKVLDSDISITFSPDKNNVTFESTTADTFLPFEITTSKNNDSDPIVTKVENEEIHIIDQNSTNTMIKDEILIGNHTFIKQNLKIVKDKSKFKNLDNERPKIDESEKLKNTTHSVFKNTTTKDELLHTNSSKIIEHKSDPGSVESNDEVPIFTELDTEELTEVPEDYYDSKDVMPTTAPKSDALTVIIGLAGSVVESVVETFAEKVVPKGIFDLYKRMRRQNEALESERLRSREENGGLGQFGRGILKTISSNLGKPLSQLMAGVRDIGSLDTDRGFVGNLASSVTSVANVANGVLDAFKDRVQAIYPGTVWCGDGHSATARSGDLGLFFFTDTCCRQHDACKIYIKAGETKYGLTNTGLFTRSHCSCDLKFRECLRKTNSLVSGQIGLTYFNVLGPQCFRMAHPIVRCIKRTRLTGQKCEEYELDYTKPKMWQWFDNETF